MPNPVVAERSGPADDARAARGQRTVTTMADR
jgi:hypothetical protein